MTVIQINAYVQAFQALVSAGVYVANQIRAFVRAINPQASDEELNAIIRAVQEDARRRKALAEADLAALDTGDGDQPA